MIMSLDYPTPTMLQATHNKTGIDFTKALLENFPPKKTYTSYLEEMSAGYVREYILNNKFLGFDGATVDHPWGGFDEAKVWILLSFNYLEDEEIEKVFLQLDKFTETILDELKSKKDIDSKIFEGQKIFDNEIENLYENLNQLIIVKNFLKKYYV